MGGMSSVACLVREKGVSKRKAGSRRGGRL
jgi:hypothetical protein